MFIFIFWSRCCCCCRSKSVLTQREVPATVCSLYVYVLDTAMLRTSIATVVLGCFYFCPLDCDASADWKNIKVAHLLRVLQQNAIYTYLVRIQNFLFYSPFDEIYRRLLFFTVGRSIVQCDWVRTAALSHSPRFLLTTSVLKQRERCRLLFLVRFCPLHCDTSDVYCWCCPWLLIFVL